MDVQTTKHFSRWGLALLSAALLALGCGEDEEKGPGGGGGPEPTPCNPDCPPWNEATSPTPAEIATVKGLKIFFAHKSVGDNIVNGIKNISDINVRQVYVQQLNSVGSSTAFFEHDMVPSNANPTGKIEAFEEAMERIHNNGNTVDIAFMKFCYADIYEHTNVKEIFDAYAAAMARLRTQFPKVRFLHVTVPLERYNNTQREVLNDMLRAYGGEHGEQVFDLAKLEATRSDGTVAKQQDGSLALADEWAPPNDSHLNSAGQKYVAGSLISFLAQVNLNK